jgi:hypothetical protein
LTDATTLIGGSIRYFRSQEHRLREVEDQEPEDLERVCDFLLPFCRTFVANWSQSNRREAGYAMAHLVGSGQASQQILTAMSELNSEENGPCLPLGNAYGLFANVVR